MCKLIFMLILAAMFQSCAPSTTIFFVRHCEKESAMPNADLNAQGRLRAQQLAHTLQNVKFAKIYTTNVPRAASTAEPLRLLNNIDSVVYNYHDTLYMAKILAEDYEAKNVMVVGHSDNIPAMIRNLGGTMPYHEIPLDEFDNLFVVVVQKRQPTKVMHLKYGE